MRRQHGSKFRLHLVQRLAVVAVAVDAVLSLGFINTDNIGTFLKSRPLLEEAQSRLSELLLASRIGLNEVPEAALERILPGLEKVLEGLRTIQFGAAAA